MILKVALDLPADKLFDYLPHATEPLPEVGSRVLVTCAGAKRCGVVVGLTKHSSIATPRLKTIDGRLLGARELPKDLLQVAVHYANQNLIAPGKMVFTCLPPQLRKAQDYQYSEKEIDYQRVIDDSPPALSVGQRKMTNQLLRAGSGKPILLTGLPNSGMEAVLLEQIAKTITSGKKVLLIASVVAQAVYWRKLISKRLAKAIVIELHSSLTASERMANWQQISAGYVDAVVGVRGTVFAPVTKLGLITVVNEHDNNHRADKSICYSGRDLAAQRALAVGCKLVLMSATPSLEVFAAATKGKVRKLKMEPATKQLAKVSVIDISDRRLFGGISGELEGLVRNELMRGGKVAILVHRGYKGGALFCQNCRKFNPCPACNGLLIKVGDNCVCKHCGQKRPLLTSCRQCGQSNIEPMRAISSRISEALAVRLPEARIVNLVAEEDITSVQRKLTEGEVDVVVGSGHQLTQLNTMFGSIAAADIDNILQSNRLSAPVEFLSSMLELSSRSSECNLFAQTRCVNHHIFEALRLGDYDSYANIELSERKKIGLPPARRLGLLKVNANSAEDAARFLGMARQYATASTQTEEIHHFEPVATKQSIGGQQMQMLISVPMRQQLISHVRELDLQLAQADKPHNLTYNFEIDPDQW